MAKKTKLVSELTAEEKALLTPEVIAEMEREEQEARELEEAAKQLASKRSVGKLKEPDTFHIIGSIVAQSFRKRDIDNGGKFKHDTHILIIEELSTQSQYELFITKDQWKAYACDQHIFPMNVINVKFEENIKDVTGYKADANDVELTAHDKTFNSFNSMTDLSIIGLVTQLGKIGLDTDSKTAVINMVAQARSVKAAEDRLKGGSTRQTLFDE